MSGSSPRVNPRGPSSAVKGAGTATIERTHRGKRYAISRAHPVADLLPWLDDAELQSLADDISEHEQRQPIYRLPDERIIDGRNRELACLIAGVAPLYQQLDVAESAIPALIASLNLHRRHLSIQQRREIAAAILRAEPNRSNRSIAKTVGVDHKTVGRERGRLESSGQIPHTQAWTGSDGVQQTIKRQPEHGGEIPHQEPIPSEDSRDLAGVPPGAEEEDVSHEQARQDLREATVKGLTVAVPDRIAGLDGRARPSTRRPQLASTPAWFEEGQSQLKEALGHLRKARDLFDAVLRGRAGKFLVRTIVGGEDPFEFVSVDVTTRGTRIPTKKWVSERLAALIAAAKLTAPVRVCAGCRGGDAGCRECRQSGFIPYHEAFLEPESECPLDVGVDWGEGDE